MKIWQNNFRCVYSTAPIVILDNPFSAVDNKVSSNILGKMKNNFIIKTNVKCFIGKAIINILLKKKRTVILTTDNPFLLKHAKVGQKIEMDFKLKFVHSACGSAWGRKNQESRFLWWYHWWVSTNCQAKRKV